MNRQVSKINDKAKNKSLEENAKSNILFLALDVDSKSLENKNIIIHKEFSSEKAFKRLSQYDFSVVVVSFEQKENKALRSFLESVKKKYPYIPRIVVVEKINDESMLDSINSFGVTKLVLTDDQRSLSESISKSIEIYYREINKQNLYHKSSSQNKKLQELTDNLEGVVLERTQYIVESREEVQRRISNLKKLVLFIKHLSGIRDLEELLPLLKIEFKKIHHLSTPILAINSMLNEEKVFYFNKRIVLEKDIESLSRRSPNIGVNQRSDSAYLADIFSRPFGKVLSIPLRNSSDSDRKGKKLGVLYFEHDLSDVELKEFLSLMNQRLQPICVTVDRILLELQAKYVSSQWEGTFEGLKSPVSIIDKDFSVVRSNSFFSLEKKEEKCHRRFSLGKGICIGCPAKEAIKENKSVRGRIHSNGKIFDVHSYPIMAYGNRGPTHVINQYVDITASRKLYGNIVQNEKMIAMGSLAAHVTHELNNPLTGLRSLSQLLIEELKNAENISDDNLLKDLIEIEKASSRSQDIIKNLLEFSNSTDIDDVEVVSLHKVIHKTLPLLKSAFRDFNNIVELVDGDDRVSVNPVMLQQVIFNLVKNACQAMGETGELIIRTQHRNDKKKEDGKIEEWLDLTIKDTGPGIPKSVLPYIFEPFFTTKNEGSGTGLGLSMCKSIIEKYKGRIEVESHLGKGTTFLITLPLDKMSA